MSRYGIVSLNYLAAGGRRLAVNLDSIVGYELSAVDHILSPENSVSAAIVGEGGLSATAIQAKLSCCSERMKAEISAFDSSRLRRNRSFVLELDRDGGFSRNTFTQGSFMREAMYDAVDEAMKTAERKPRSALPKICEPTPTDDEYIP